MKKRNKKMIVKDDVIVIYEKIKNDTNGNPRFELDIFKNNQYLDTKRITSYSIEEDIKAIVKEF